MIYRVLVIQLYLVQLLLFLFDFVDFYVFDCKKFKFWLDLMIIIKLFIEKIDFQLKFKKYKVFFIKVFNIFFFK